MRLSIKQVLKELRAVIARDFEVEMSDVLTYKDIATYFELNKTRWGLLKSTTTRDFFQLLQEEGVIREVTYNFSQKLRGTRFLTPKGTHLEAITSLRPGSFLSHAGAAFAHGLLRSEPFLLVFNKEQIAVESVPMPPQDAIDRAFQGKQRSSNARAEIDGIECLMVHSKDIGRMEVSDIKINDPWNNQSILIPCTSLERTLVDMVVRPAYSGGLDTILHAWSQSAGQVSIDRLFSIYRKMDFTYPYFQVFGWIMEYTGQFSAKEVDVFRQLPITRNFYAIHGFKKGVLDFNEDWRLFVPKGMK